MSRFIREANKGYNDWYLYLITIVAVLVAVFLGQLPTLFVVNNRINSGIVDPARIEQFWNSPDFSLLGIPTFIGLALIMLGHVVAAVALYMCVRGFHKRKFISVVTARRPFDLRRFGVGFSLWFGLTVLLEVVMYVVDPANYTLQLDMGKWLPLIAICLLIVPIQTSIEEIFIRGYLFQGIGKATGSALTAVMLTSVIFISMHLANPEVQNFGIGVMMVYYGTVAVFLAILTYLDDGLELALGVHAATNIYGASFVTFEGSVMQTDAIYRLHDVNAWWMTAGFLMMIVIFTLIVKRIYPIRPFSFLFEPIDQNDNSEIQIIYDEGSFTGGASDTTDDMGAG